jgi:MoaA/NifB/PqqE/SkfB family radical SAM enzyme
MPQLITLNQYVYYAKWFFASMVGRRDPLVNTMMINFNCNLRCKHCSVRENEELLPGQKSLSYKDAVEEMELAFEKGARILFFEGGEPTLWKDGDKDLKDLIRAGKDVGYFVTGYTTNGTNVIHEESDVISISLDGPRAVHDEIRGAGVFDKLMSNLNKTTHPNVFANMVVMQDNKKYLRETVQVVADNPHINGIMINFLTPPPDSQALTLADKESIVAQAIQLKREGMPILNSDRALKEMLVEDYEAKCPYWVSGFVLPDRSHHYGCPMRGTKACKQCGFNAVREYYLITKGSPSVISQMSSRFAFSKK